MLTNSHLIYHGNQANQAASANSVEEELKTLKKLVQDLAKKVHTSTHYSFESSEMFEENTFLVKQVENAEKWFKDLNFLVLRLVFIDGIMQENTHFTENKDSIKSTTSIKVAKAVLPENYLFQPVQISIISIYYI